MNAWWTAPQPSFSREPSSCAAGTSTDSNVTSPCHERNPGKGRVRTPGAPASTRNRLTSFGPSSVRTATIRSVAAVASLTNTFAPSGLTPRPVALSVSPGPP